MTKLRMLVSTLGLVAALVTGPAIASTKALASQASTTPKPVAIDIDNFKFGIVSIKIDAGTTVTWTNRDDVPHTVFSTTKVFKSPPLDTGEAFSYTFKDAGTFKYYCSLHPRMTGEIVVK